MQMIGDSVANTSETAMQLKVSLSFATLKFRITLIFLIATWAYMLYTR